MLAFLFNAALMWLGFQQGLDTANPGPYIKQLYLLKDPLISNNTAIKTVGFNTVIVFQIGVDLSADIFFVGANNTVPIVAANGKYVGGSDYADTICGYKNGSTTIDRVELALVYFQNITDIIASNGTGQNTVLYQNFEALKEAWCLDAINNDDEFLYNVSSTVAFAGMLGQMGYKYTAAPYTNQDFWAQIVSEINQQTPGMFDRAYVQTYDGGYGNDPGEWGSVLGMPVVPLIWVTNTDKPVYGKTPEEAQQCFAMWHATENIAGGGYWDSNDIENIGNGAYNAYAEALNNVFG